MTTKHKATKTMTPTKATSPAKATPPAKAKSPAKTKTKVGPPSTTFSLYAPEASKVFLVGDFNDWQTGDLKAKKFKDGTWRKALALTAGTYQYLFLVDDQWWPDPANPSRVPNPFGTENSVIKIG